MNFASAAPVSKICFPLSTTSRTQITFRPEPPKITFTFFPSRGAYCCEQFTLAALADAARAALISVLRFTLLCTLPTVPEPLFWNFAPGLRSTFPVTNSDPVIARLPPGPMQTSPRMPPAGPVIETLPRPSSSTVQPATASRPSAVSTQPGQPPPAWQAGLSTKNEPLIVCCALVTQNAPIPCGGKVTVEPAGSVAGWINST